MIVPPTPCKEAARLAKLKSLNLLDTPAEERFDRVTRLAKRLFDVDIALVSLVDDDRQWFKSRCGLDATETSRDVSFCGHAILEDHVMVVPDALEDERFADNPLVTNGPKIRFYAGSPINADDGSHIGTLCIIDDKPRELDAEELDILRDLTVMIEREIAAAKLATSDELTGLTNRRGLLAMGDYTLALSRRSDRPVTLLFFDLDGFKRINDELGHAEGDRALVEFGQCLVQSFRDSDVVARIGGDEFSVLSAGADEAGLQRPLERLDTALGERNAKYEERHAIRYSAGTMSYDPDRHTSLATLLNEADDRMYAAKKKRKRFFTPAA